MVSFILGNRLPIGRILYVALSSAIYGIGNVTAIKICRDLGIDYRMRVDDLTEEQILMISNQIKNNYIVGGDLRARVHSDISRLQHIKSYRGLRLAKGLPVRGQRTHSNAKTSRKLKKRYVGGK
jgi:small subunit ribosomal protein S13